MKINTIVLSEEDFYCLKETAEVLSRMSEESHNPHKAMFIAQICTELEWLATDFHIKEDEVVYAEVEEV